MNKTAISKTAMSGLNGVEYFDFPSRHIDQTFRIFVASPEFIQPGETYPVIYVLDANAMFATTMEIQRALTLGGENPQAYVVGIGYPVANGFVETLATRFRDLTPTAGGPVEAAVLTGNAPGADVSMGGGPDFIRFIAEELKPQIETDYAVKPDDACIAGASLGGLMACWTLLHRPNVFQRYVCISPSIWWEGEEVWQWIDSYRASHNDRSAQVYISAGDLETVAEMKKSLAAIIEGSGDANHPLAQTRDFFEQHGWLKMAEITPLLASTLSSAGNHNLTVGCRNFPDETHISVVPSAMSRGLRFVFGHIAQP